MKHFSIILLVGLAATTTGCHLGNCEEGSGNIITQNRFTGENRQSVNFNRVRIDCAADLYVTQGTTPSVRIEAEDNIMPMITTDLAGETLAIDTRGCYSTSRQVKVYVTMPVVKGFIMNGSGDIKGETAITTDQLDLQIDGSGDIDLQVEAGRINSSIDGSGRMLLRGHAGSYLGEIDGSGDIEALDLAADSADVTIGGSGNARVHVMKNLKATIQGSGDVHYRGTPAVQSSVGGSGQVIKIP